MDGAVAQLGERVVRNDEVEGSIPFSSTFCNRSNFKERPVSTAETGLFDLRTDGEQLGLRLRAAEEFASFGTDTPSKESPHRKRTVIMSLE